MNGFTENRASGASERPGRDDRVLTWGASHAMLPLVARIARDVVRYHQRLATLQPERARLDRDRREFWQRAEDRNRHTARVYDRLGLPEFYALEGLVPWRDPRQAGEAAG